MRLTVTILALLLLPAPPSAGETARPGTAGDGYTLERALTLRSISGLSWSRDTRRLAFVVAEKDTSETLSNQDIWLWQASADSARRLTRHARNDWSPTFSPGGDTIAFVSARPTGEDDKTGIFMMSLRGGEPWLYAVYDESVNEVTWSPDGRWLAYVRPDSLPRAWVEWRRRKWDQVVEDERNQYPHLWVVDVATGETRRLTSGRHWIWNARWSPDSRSIAFLTSPTGKPDDANQTDIGVVRVSGGTVRMLDVIGTGSFVWSPDGRWIALAAPADRAKQVQKEDLWVIPADGGRPVNLTAGFDEDADTPAWSGGSDTLAFHAAQGVTTVVATVARAGGPVVLSTDRAAVAGAPVAADSHVAWVQSDPNHPPELWVADHVAARGRAVTALNALPPGLRLGRTEAVTWHSTDGVSVCGVLVRPPGSAANRPIKTLVRLHGGPYGSRYALGFDPITQFFAAHGYQVFMPNFRGSGGSGTAFKLRRRADWGGQDWEDVQSGLDSLVRRRLADPERLGVFGHSYGGYLSAWAITQTDRFDAAMVSAGAVDIAAHWGQSDVQQYRTWEFTGTPWEVPEAWRRSAPMTHIARAKTPTLVFAGEEDRRVPYAQGQWLYRALRTIGVPTEFVHYPREPHGYREYRHDYDRWSRTLAWFDRWVR